MSKKNKETDEWTDECETLLAEWSEKASCYRWLHGRSEKNYQKWYYGFSIPVIILSTLTGAANVGMDSFVPAESKSIASAIVGGVNIFAGIVSTLQNFLKVAELMEGHRIAGVSWGKLQRNIAIELALDPKRRVLQTDFLKLSRAEYDRLIEAGPIVDDGIIAQFNKKFKNYEVSKPSICNGLDKCNIYKIDKTIEMNKSEFTEGIEDLIEKENMSPKKAPLDIKIDNLKKDDTDDEVEDLIPEKNINVDISNNVVENIDNKDDLVDESNTKDTQTEDNIDEEVDDKDSETLMTDFLDAIDDNHKENKKE
ncbi:SLATT domain-containing protein [bacterium]|nr:SLATT domain-containing protein [bacterium]